MAAERNADASGGRAECKYGPFFTKSTRRSPQSTARNRSAPTLSLAAGIGDANLAAQVTTTKSRLAKLPDNDLNTFAKQVHLRAQENQAQLVADVDISPVEVAQMDGKRQLYQNLIPGPRDKEITLGDAIQQHAALYPPLLKMLKDRLDKLMAGYETTQPTFWNKYTAARIIVDNPGPGQPPPAPPHPHPDPRWPEPPRPAATRCGALLFGKRTRNSRHWNSSTAELPATGKQGRGEPRPEGYSSQDGDLYGYDAPNQTMKHARRPGLASADLMPLNLTISNPPTQAELQTLADRLDEMLTRQQAM